MSATRLIFHQYKSLANHVQQLPLLSIHHITEKAKVQEAW